MDPVELALISPALVATVVEATRRAVQLWAGHWGIDEASLEVAVVPEGTVSTASGTWWVETGRQPAARLCCPKSLGGDLAHLLYHSPAGHAPGADSLAARSVQHVEGELRRLLGQAWRVEEWTEASEPLNAAPGRWHAPMDLRIDIGSAVLHAQLPAARLRQPAPSRVPAPMLKPPHARSAFAHHSLRMTAVLGSAEISVADLAALQPGDVLVLDTRVADAAQLVVENTALALPVTLGCQGDRLAVQFASPSSRHSQGLL